MNHPAGGNLTAFQRYEQRLTAARMVFHAAAAADLPAPRLIGGLSAHELATDLSLYFTEPDQAHAWAEWMGVLMVQRSPTNWEGVGEMFDQELRVVWVDEARRAGSVDTVLVPLVGAAS